MKRTAPSIVGTHLALLGSLIAQGPLTPPPGPPQSTMRTLEQVEPRTDVATLPGSADAMHVLTEPGSYFLSANLDVTTTNGIVIQSGGVTLDLGGFTLLRSSTAPASGTAILFAQGADWNITIQNGQITGGVTFTPGAGNPFSGSGFENGIEKASNVEPGNVTIRHLSISGCSGNGIDIISTEDDAASNTVVHCSVRVTGSGGISAGQVSHSTAVLCGATAISATGDVSHSWGEAVGTAGRGIFANGSVAHSFGSAKTTGSGTNSHGIQTGGNVTDSRGLSETADGIRATGNVSGSIGVTTSTSSLSDGIHAEGNVTASEGTTAGGTGVFSGGNVIGSTGNSTGVGTGHHGIDAEGNVTTSTGRATGEESHGINSGGSVASSRGNGGGDRGNGILCNFNVSDSTGIGGTGDNAVGIRSLNANIENSFGTSEGVGILGINVSNSTGLGKLGILATSVASYSTGFSSSGEISIQAKLAIGCITITPGTEDVQHRFLMP